MPYTYKKQGDKYVVYKKSNGKKVGSTAGTKTALNKYLAALHIHEPKKESKKTIKENMEYENKVGQLYVVQKPSAGCDMAGMVYEVDPITGIQPHGVDAQTVHGVYASMEEAQKVAEKLYDGHMTGMKKLEEKKGKVTEKLTKTISNLEKKHKSMMEMAKANPKEASMHKGKIAEIQAKIQELMDKLEKVEKSKTPIEEKEEDKKSLKENVGGNLDKLKQLLNTHDWDYSSSDDHMKYINGQKEFDTIVRLAISNGDSGINLLADKFKEKFNVPDENMEDVKKSFINYFGNTSINENEGGDLETLKNLLNTHDWFYTFSDDPRVYSKGTQEITTIKNLAKKLGDDGIKMYVTKFKEKFPNADVEKLTKMMKGQ